MSNKKYYDKYWQGNNSNEGHANNTPKWPEQELAMFLGSVRKFIGKRILDIGAGEGIFLSYIQSKNHSFDLLAALEISEFAFEKGKNINPLVDYRLGSAEEEYPFASEKFDTIFMTDVIEHLLDIDMALMQCNKVLTDKGRLIIITPVFNIVKRIIISLFFWEKIFYPNNPHIRFFTKKSMDMIMKKHGFKRIYYKWGLTWFGLIPQNAYFVYEKIK